jgi:hypothetical protein
MHDEMIDGSRKIHVPLEITELMTKKNHTPFQPTFRS